MTSAADRSRERRRRARRRAIARRRLGAVAVLIAICVALVLGLGGGASASRPAVPRRTTAHAASRRRAATVGATRRTATTVSATADTHPPAPSPGTLPQTDTFPSGTTAQFRSLMAQLWAGVVHDSTALALPAFFPQAAYVQLKSITGAAADWSDRLVHDYSLDIAAAHALLGGDAAAARLVGVEVTARYGHWIPPGVCDNGIGYYEMPNARVVYRAGGQVRSFGIASMISWRGVWYVVHLGAILRATDTGMVDDRAIGPGVSLYAGTC